MLAHGFTVGMMVELVNAGLAQGKHRSGLMWFLVSLLLGPAATLILVFLDDLRDRDERR